MDTTLVLDLEAAHPQWQSRKQPFLRRALVAAAHHGKMYVVGGFDEKAQVVKEVAVYDPATDVWTKVADLPVDKQNSFAPAAAVENGSLYSSVADGALYRLDATQRSWEKVGQSTPRLAHRIVAEGGRVLVIGGAAKGKNSDLVEAVAVR